MTSPTVTSDHPRPQDQQVLDDGSSQLLRGLDSTAATDEGSSTVTSYKLLDNLEPAEDNHVPVPVETDSVIEV